MQNFLISNVFLPCAPLFFVDACNLAKLCQKRMIVIDVFDFTEMLAIFQIAFEPKFCSDDARRRREWLGILFRRFGC